MHLTRIRRLTGVALVAATVALAAPAGASRRIPPTRPSPSPGRTSRSPP